MPDWSYQTLFRPLLFKIPARLSRSVTLTAIGKLGRLPAGSFVILTLGHMEPSPLLARDMAGIAVNSPVGLSGGVDPEGIAQKALAQFGFGFIEHGPVTVQPIRSNQSIENSTAAETIRYPTYYENDGIDVVAARIAKPGHHLPQLARVTPMPHALPDDALAELGSMMKKLHTSGAAGFYVDVLQAARSFADSQAILNRLPELVAANNYADKPIYLYVPPDYPNERLIAILSNPKATIWSGVVIGEAVRAGGSFGDKDGGEAICVGREGKALALDKIKLLRSMCDPSLVIKAGGGVHEPQDALDLMKAGADGVMLHSGLVYAGPGLPKRINEAIVYEQLNNFPVPETPSFWKHWGWMCLLGIGMMLGGIFSWIIAATSVLLPYDLAFIGMSLEELHQINHNLLHFMSHDRITLAGTMISIGILYYQLAKHGLREGLNWARTALLTSGFVGFISFFLYLGYGYFDPFHALASAILLPMFFLSMRSNPEQPYRRSVNLCNDRVWQRAMWGQLCFVVLGFALAIGGLTIALVGVTNVFVKTDLAYLYTSFAQLNEMNAKLIPLIAHDRAGFGGALLCDALAILIIALWGIQQGARWLWWTLLLGGAPGFYAGFSVHLSIGYTDFWHLSPAIFALLLYVFGLILLYPYLMKKPPLTSLTYKRKR